MSIHSIRHHRPVIVLLGPTAVGKSRVAVQVAKRLGTEVLAADSRQVYRGMDIGTDKPTEEERQGIAHRLIDLADPDQPFNAGRYRQAALSEIDRLYEAGRLPLIVGGTGLYIRTLVRGLCPAPQSDPEIRAELARLSREQGRDRLYAELVRVDPDTAARLHPNDEAKILRALEVHRLSGLPLSALHREHAFQDRPFAALLLGLRRPKEELYRRIEDRIDWQLAHGMVEETRALLTRGYGRGLGSMKGLGYRQVAAYVAGEYDYDEMVRRFKRDTRRFAKRQLTWFRKELGIEWIATEETEPLEHTVDRVVERIERFLGALAGRPENAVLQQQARVGESV
ncbi:tRNA (adenosine(37)-N6)-dimethylallyltransferase MiaA [Nitrospira moscoviensis]|uniref:tRNA dimethylallyltransferase n=1 Tax=Nitrospira moscoviensis TaxID=42253 RepID=A0A0K2GGJ2_NITMO|nr:tRNA (adenosine(37)-N6)-dimethylallyltransferase MiaA [Nitrospira moscoviensis]ALA60083.1 delta(2)-isopentenylpyrophosphate tRNA-adenosine transferase [Nitrospira moscoviensis]